MGEQARDDHGRFAAAAGAAEAASAKANAGGKQAGVNARNHREAAVAHHKAAMAARAEGQPQSVIDKHKDARDEHEQKAQKAEDNLSPKTRSATTAGSKAPPLAKFAEKHAPSALGDARQQANAATVTALRLQSEHRDSGKDKDHDIRATAHEKAANAHNSLAAKYRKAGETALASAHEKKAKAHIEAAEDHRDRGRPA